MRCYEGVTVPPPAPDGRQVVALNRDHGCTRDYPFTAVSSVQLKANDNGTPVRAQVQMFDVFGTAAVSLFREDGLVVPEGRVGLIIEARV